jgi:hypothetical protein
MIFDSDKNCLVYMFISGIFLLLYFTNRRYKDMERYYINNNKLKYKILLYSKYVLIFAFMYNCRFIVYNLLKKLRK